jgi:hypothetical protein
MVIVSAISSWTTKYVIQCTLYNSMQLTTHGRGGSNHNRFFQIWWVQQEPLYILNQCFLANIGLKLVHLCSWFSFWMYFLCRNVLKCTQVHRNSLSNYYAPLDQKFIARHLVNWREGCSKGSSPDLSAWWQNRAREQEPKGADLPSCTRVGAWPCIKLDN